MDEQQITPDQLRAWLESVSQLLTKVHDAVPPAGYDWLAAELGKLTPEGVGFIASLFGVDAARLGGFLTEVQLALPELKGTLASPVAVGFARFLHDAEQRTLLLNLIARWL